MVITGVLLAIVIILGLTPLGLIPLGFIYVTILCVPVIIGVLLNGLKSGLVLGLGFGLTSFYTAMTKPSTLVMPLVERSVPAVLFMCVLPRLLVPLIAFLVYKFLSTHKQAGWHVSAAAAAGSLTNTFFYLGIMLILYICFGLNAQEILTLVAGTGVIAGLSEALVAALICTPVATALKKFIK